MIPPSPTTMKQILLFSLLPISLLCLLIFLLPTHHHRHHYYNDSPLSNPFPPPPKLAYFISGSNRDGPRMVRLLQAAYHPRNYYLLHLDQRASSKQRDQLASMVALVPIFVEAGNVAVVKDADFVNEEGSSPLALVLHAAAILLRWKLDWDWFINLAASDYPLIPQDDLLHILSFLPKDFNFVETNTSKEYERVLEVIVDSRLYLQSGGKMFTGKEKRTTPNSFTFFAGSPHVILNHDFLKFVILGWENLPRTLLLYFTNTRLSHKAYFQTLAHNSEFSHSIIHSNLRINYCDAPCDYRDKSTRFLDAGALLASGAAFAGNFPADDPMLDKIDSVRLNRGWGDIAPGGWCLGRAWSGRVSCSEWGNSDILRPGPAAERLEKLLVDLIGSTSFKSRLLDHYLLAKDH